MKKIVLIATLFISTLSFAQQEVKLDLFDALALKTLEVSYEYYISDDSSVGAWGLLNFEKNKSNDFKYNQKSMFAPYFRQYFSNDKKWNIFGEVFFGVNSGESEIKDSANKIIGYKGYTDAALGVSVGTKYILASGLTLEAYGGLGRNLFTSDSHKVVPRVGFNIGYRL